MQNTGMLPFVILSKTQVWLLIATILYTSNANTATTVYLVPSFQIATIFSPDLRNLLPRILHYAPL